MVGDCINTAVKTIAGDAVVVVLSPFGVVTKANVLFCCRKEQVRSRMIKTVELADGVQVQHLAVPPGAEVGKATRPGSKIWSREGHARIVAATLIWI